MVDSWMDLNKYRPHQTNPVLSGGGVVAVVAVYTIVPRRQLLLTVVAEYVTVVLTLFLLLLLLQYSIVVLHVWQHELVPLVRLLFTPPKDVDKTELD